MVQNYYYYYLREQNFAEFLVKKDQYNDLELENIKKLNIDVNEVFYDLENNLNKLFTKYTKNQDKSWLAEFQKTLIHISSFIKEFN